MAILEIQGLKTHFKTDDGWLHAVDGVDISVDRGETVCVVGESGCGKSVTAMTVLKLVPMPPGKIVAGRVMWQGRDLVPLSSDEMRKMRAKEIAIVFQEPMTSLNPVLHGGRADRRGAAPAREPVAQGRDGQRGARCCAACASPRPSAASTTTRTSSPAACASA